MVFFIFIHLFPPSPEMVHEVNAEARRLGYKIERSYTWGRITVNPHAVPPEPYLDIDPWKARGLAIYSGIALVIVLLSIGVL